ncbi:MAG: P1 family peptidase [Gemmatimonadaceae bacterium]|nr:P1 family peptidase [Gemmatimonadaceae bacterium]
MKIHRILSGAVLFPLLLNAQTSRPRARDIGLVTGVFTPGVLNGITDVPGVTVGQFTVIEGDSIRTGITAILPHAGNTYKEKVPAAVVIGNGFGKLVGYTQIHELGEIETPILLTCTLCVWKAADAMVSWLLAKPDMQEVRSINAVVGETNDRGVNDIRARPIKPEHVVRALESASAGPVEEGSVGAGTGTRAFRWKGGIGTSSRKLPASLGGYTVGVLVQSNFGGMLTMNGAPVGRELGGYPFQRETETAERGQGSIMIVVATDAPLNPRTLERLGTRALLGLARTGGNMGNGSGDYVISFSTAKSVRRFESDTAVTVQDIPNEPMSQLFQAAAEATEEAIYNSILKATTTKGYKGAVLYALPLDSVMPILRRFNAIQEVPRRNP